MNKWSDLSHGVGSIQQLANSKFPIRIKSDNSSNPTNVGPTDWSDADWIICPTLGTKEIHIWLFREQNYVDQSIGIKIYLRI